VNKGPGAEYPGYSCNYKDAAYRAGSIFTGKLPELAVNADKKI